MKDREREIPKRLRAVFSDKINHSQGKIYHPEIHLAADFDEPLDRPRLKRALRLVLNAEPILGCRFRDSWLKPFWERLDPAALEAAGVLTEFSGPAEDCGAAEQAFYGELLDYAAGPQLRALLLPRAGGGERLILKVAHMACDAGGVKEIFYGLADIYGRLALDPAYEPEPRTGSRSMVQVYLRFPFRKWPSILWSGLVAMWRMVRPLRSFQVASGGVRKPPLLFIFRHFSRKRVSALAAYARSRGATLNDLMTAAFFRALTAVEGGRVRGRLRMVSTVDLRRYLPERRTGGLCQVLGLYAVGIPYRPGEDFAGTLAAVKESIDPQKEQWFGLGMMLFLRLVGLCQPYFYSKFLMRSTWRLGIRDGNLPPGFTNMGPIDEAPCRFGGKLPAAVFLGVPSACPPWFAAGLSGYSGTLTLSAGFYPSAIPADWVEDLFDRVESELDSALAAG